MRNGPSLARAETLARIGNPLTPPPPPPGQDDDGEAAGDRPAGLSGWAAWVAQAPGESAVLRELSFIHLTPPPVVVEAASLCSSPVSGSDSSPSVTPSCAAGDLCGEAASGRTTYWLNNEGGRALRLGTLGHGESAGLDEAMARRRQQPTWKFGRLTDAVADDLTVQDQALLLRRPHGRPNAGQGKTTPASWRAQRRRCRHPTRCLNGRPS